MNDQYHNGHPDEPGPIANIEAEAALLGALMIDNRLIGETFTILKAEDFFEPAHRLIFKALHKFDEKGMNANPVTLRPVFEHDPTLREIGGAGYLAGLTGSGAALIGARDFARQVADLAARRTLVEAAEKVISTARNGYMDSTIGDMVAEFDSAVRLSADRVAVSRPRTAEDMIQRTIDRQNEAISAEQVDRPGCKSIADIDTLIGTPEPGLLIIAGRPGMGKSVLAQSAAWGWAANGYAVEYYMAEMSEEQANMRLTSDLSLALGHPIKHEDIKKLRLGAVELRTLERARDMAKLLPLRFHNTDRCDIREIDSLVARAKHRWAAQGKELSVVVVDYLQLLKFGKESNDFVRISAISKALVDIWKRHGVMVVALSQLSRDVDSRKDKRPMLSDLRGSGELEQDADAVLGVYRAEEYLEAEEPPKGDSKEWEAWNVDYQASRGKMDLIGLKARHNKRSTRTARFIGQNFAVRGGSFNEWSSQPTFDLEDEESLL